MKKGQFLNMIQQTSKILGSFKNEYNEEYTIYQQEIAGHKFLGISGDELDWEMGYTIQLTQDGNIIISKMFLIDDKERKEIASILEKNDIIHRSNIVLPDKDKMIHFLKPKK